MKFDPTPFVRGCYKLPGNPAIDEYMVPCSGGADSTALAIMMSTVFPDAPLRFLFTDTNADEVEIYETLDNLEAFIGRKIERIIPQRGLYELVEDYGGFLPSSRDRWCTRALKLRPYERYLAGIKPIMGGQVWSFVGIRADEPWRSGLISGDDDVHTELPYKAWGVGRADVFQILDRTIGIPRYYQRRSRSGCYSCWGQRRSEVIGLLEAHPVEFHKAGAYEKLSPKDEAKKREYVALADELGIGHNWVGFPIPRELDLRNKETQRTAFSGWQFFDLKAVKPDVDGKVLPFPAKRWEGDAATNWKSIGKAATEGEQPSLLSLIDPVERLWVGVEFRIDPGIGGDGVFWQQLISYSSSRGGLSRQLQMHFEHRLQTAEAVGLTPDEVRAHVRYGVYCIEAPRGVVDVEAPSDGSFTWRAGDSFDRVERLAKFAKRTLHAARIEQDARIADAEGKPAKAKCLRAQRDGITGPLGLLIGMASYLPKEPQPNAIDEDETTVPCFACSI